MLKNVALLGLGSIGMSVVELWKKNPPAGHRLAWVCGRERQTAAAKDLLPQDVAYLSSIDDLLAARPHVVIEAAGHQAVIDHGCRILRSGADLYLLSTGVLADPAMRVSLLVATQDGGSAIVVPAGALAGFDGLKAIAMDSDAEVTYISTKPPLAWVGTPVEKQHDLDAITMATTVFDGSAGEAARLFPRNANLAATVATAGIGFAKTRVILIADPASEGNLGQIKARNSHSSLDVKVDGAANPENRKTSRIVGYSVISALDNSAQRLRFA